VLNPTNNTGIVLTAMGNLPGLEGSGTGTGTRERWLVFPAAWGPLEAGLGAGIGYK